MKVREVMISTPFYCVAETNLGSATELMWNASCGFLPVEAEEGKVIGVITDRDICIALGTRNRLAGDVKVGEVMSGRLYFCGPEDDIHSALHSMKQGKVRRLPVIAGNGSLVGVVSMDDVLLRTESTALGKEPELGSDEVVRTYRAITRRPVPQVALHKAAVA